MLLNIFLKYFVSVTFILATSQSEFMTSCDVINFVRDFMENLNWYHVTFINGFKLDFSVQNLISFGINEGRFIRYVKRVVDEDNETTLFQWDQKFLKKRQGFVCFWDSSILGYLEMASKSHHFHAHYEWLIVLDEKDSIENFKNHLNNLYIYTDSEVYVAKINGKHSVISVWEIWKIGPGMKFEEDLFGEWKPSSGFDRRIFTNKYDRRKNMKGFRLKAVVPKDNFLFDDTNEFEYSAAIWLILKDLNNFTLNTTGGNGWIHMIKMLVTKEQDVFADTLIVTLKRHKIIDYTLQINRFGIKLYIRQPIAKASDSLYFQPFTHSIWWAIFSSVIITGLLLWILNKVGTSYACHQYDIAPLSLTNAIWNTFVRLLQRDPGRNPSSYSCQIILFIWSVSCFVIATSYSAVLVSFLTTLKPVFPFQTLEDILRKPDWNIVAHKYSTIKDNLRLAPEGSIYKEVWKRNVEPDLENNMIVSEKEGLKKVLKGKFAFLTMNVGVDIVIKNHLTPEEAEQITNTGVDYFSGRLAFGFQKHSPFSGFFSYFILKLTQTGHLYRLKKNFYGKAKNKTAAGYATPGISEVFVLFACLGVGLIASLFVLTLEIWINSRKKKSLKCSR